MGTSPINLPDPSLFSDFHDQDLGEGQSNKGQGGTSIKAARESRNNHIIEQENEKRKLEQIYMVAGEDKKTHISAIELYGFFSWNLSAIAFVLYLIWAFVPDHILNKFGIYYIPDKYYAIAFPLWFAVTLFAVLQLYATFCIYYTPNLGSYETL